MMIDTMAVTQRDTLGALQVLLTAGVPVLLQLIAEAWQHGRRSPAFMDIDWESEWSDSIETIRARHGIPVYQSALPANLLETLQGD